MARYYNYNHNASNYSNDINCSDSKRNDDTTTTTITTTTTTATALTTSTTTTFSSFFFLAVRTQRIRAANQGAGGFFFW
jgi:hypothetical protein